MTELWFHAAQDGETTSAKWKGLIKNIGISPKYVTPSSPKQVYDDWDIAVCGLFIPREEEKSFDYYMNALRDANYKIPEIQRNIPIDFQRKFGYGITAKIPFMPVGYDGDLNLAEAQEKLRPDKHEGK